MTASQNDWDLAILTTPSLPSYSWDLRILDEHCGCECDCPGCDCNKHQQVEYPPVPPQQVVKPKQFVTKRIYAGQRLEYRCGPQGCGYQWVPQWIEQVVEQ